MILIGLTGGIGMGKSTVADYLERVGEALIDSDGLARQLVEPGQAALGEIREAFGEAVVTTRGELDRKALAGVVFRDPEARRRLESILHPKIRSAWKSKAEDWRRAGLRRAFVVIPLLYETGAEGEFGQVFCVACSPAVQNLRLKQRGWTPEEIRSRCEAQWGVEKKMDRADGVIWNESTLKICEEQCARLLDAK